MLIELRRTRENKTSTVGELVIDGKFICVTLEDAFHVPKIPHSTRIPAGTYPIELRLHGGFHGRYLKRFGPDFHKGMLWIRRVPDFEFILVHCGNTIADTDGCVLTGLAIDEIDGGSFEIRHSEAAYRKFYPPVAKAILAEEEVLIRVTDPPRPEPLVA